jgi:hypothetical protein
MTAGAPAGFVVKTAFFLPVTFAIAWLLFPKTRPCWVACSSIDFTLDMG